jgi:hypothetical protein
MCAIHDRKLLVMGALTQDGWAKGGCRKPPPPATAENDNR